MNFVHYNADKTYIFYELCTGQGRNVIIKYIIRPVEFESTHIVWKTIGLPLTYGRVILEDKVSSL